MFKEQQKILGTFGCQLVSWAGQYEQTGFQGIFVDANLWYHWLSSIRTKDLHRSERKRTKITNCFPLRGQSGFGGVGCHVCILVKKYCLSKRKNSSGELFENFKQ